MVRRTRSTRRYRRRPLASLDCAWAADADADTAPENAVEWCGVAKCSSTAAASRTTAAAMRRDGDGLHLNPDGYRTLAASVPTRLFSRP